MKHLLILATLMIFFSCKENKIVTDHLNLKSKLSGKWKAKAFDGELHEEWKLNKDGWLQQEAYYIEKNDTSYAAKTQIQQVGKEIILFSVIKGSNPKIFKSVKKDNNFILFENDDYKNPFQVKYEFISSNIYRRTIKGYEKDSLVTYQFNFEKVNQ